MVDSAMDLGCDASVGVGRWIPKRRKRFGAAVSRWRKIAKMARKNKGAHKLFSSGAHPLASYSVEIMGMAKTDMAKLRNGAAAATGCNQAGRCATTLLRILGTTGPELRLRKQQFKTWIQTCGAVDQGLRESRYARPGTAQSMTMLWIQPVHMLEVQSRAS